MQTGAGMSALTPAGVSAPVAGLMRKTTTEAEFWLAASSQAPEGSMAKLRGALPWVGSWPVGVSLPVSVSTVKMAMLSCPRFEP